MLKLSENKLIKYFFFGNYFYGLCAVFLAIETIVSLKIAIKSNFIYLFFLFFSTIVYYSFAYITIGKYSKEINERLSWYSQYKKIFFFSVLFFCLIILICAFVLFFDLKKNDLKLGVTEWLFLLIFPIISILYYGFNFRVFGSFNLRSIGLIKPFIIGFVWAGLVSIYPEMLYNIQNGLHYKINLISFLFFFKNLIFISVLCIMFDIKDYAMDYNQKLKTFVVKIGLRKTIFYIIIPLCILCLTAGLFYDLNQQLKLTKQLLNTVPFILTIIVAYFLKFRKSIFYYLIIIDGLMAVKAFFGIMTELLF